MFTYKIATNSQSDNGSLQATVTYSNGTVTITESYTDANAATIKATINSRLAQLQAAETFAASLPAGTQSQNPIS